LDFISSDILSNVGLLCFACFFGISVSIVIVVRPLLGALMLAAIFPFAIIAINDIGYTYFMSAFRFVSLVTFIMFICIFSTKHSRLDLSRLRWFLLLLLCGSFLASLRSNEFVEFENVQGIQFIKYAMYACLFLLVYNLVNEIDNMLRFAYLFVFSLSIVSVLSLVQYFTDIPLIYSPDPFYEGLSPSLRLYIGKDINPNNAANLYLIALPFTINGFLKRRETYFRLLMLSLTVLFSCALILMQSRSAILGLIIAQLFVGMSGEKRRLMLFVSYLLLVVVFYYLISSLFEYLIPDRFSLEEFSSEANMRRVRQYWATLKMMLNYPFGVGQEFYRLIVRYGGVKASAHNMFLESYVNAGLVGFFGYISATMIAIYSLWKTRIIEVSAKAAYLRTSLLSGLIAYVIHNMFHHSLWEYALWMFMGITVALVKRIRDDGLLELETDDEP